jgi:lambda repressor-like predicted transcriptional regulator
MKIDVKRLEMALANAGMNFSQVAERADISAQALNNARKGKPERPYVIGIIAYALGVETSEIIEKDDE